MNAGPTQVEPIEMNETGETDGLYGSKIVLAFNQDAALAASLQGSDDRDAAVYISGSAEAMGNIASHQKRDSEKVRSVQQLKTAFDGKHVANVETLVSLHNDDGKLAKLMKAANSPDTATAKAAPAKILANEQADHVGLKVGIFEAMMERKLAPTQPNASLNAKLPALVQAMNGDENRLAVDMNVASMPDQISQSSVPTMERTSQLMGLMSKLRQLWSWQ
jgi:hypothetical protein